MKIAPSNRSTHLRSSRRPRQLRSGRMVALSTAGILAFLGTAEAAPTWSGGGGSPFDWSVASNWSAAIAATGSSPIFAGSTGLSSNNDFVTSVNGITFNGGSGAFTLSQTSATALIVAGNILDSAAGVNETIGMNIAYGNAAGTAADGAARTITAASGASLTFAGSFTRTTTATGRGLDLVTGGGTYQFSGAVSLTNASLLTTDATHSGVSQRNNTTVNLNSGANVTITGGYWAIGQNSANTTDPAATLNVNNGASMTISATSDFEIGYNFNAGANLNTNRGILNVNNGGTFTAAFGSLANASGYVRLGVNGSTTAASITQGTVNLLTGGTLVTSRRFVTGGSLANTGVAHTTQQGNFLFDGGTLKTDGINDATDWFQSATSTQVNAQFLSMTSVKINAGGANIHTNGKNAAISFGMTEGATTGGGLTKLGAGTLTLSGINTYTGGTTVSAGTLTLASTGSFANSASVSLAAGTTLDTTAQTTFTMLAIQPFHFTIDAAGAGSAGLLAAGGLDLTNGIVDFTTVGALDDPAYTIATYMSLTGANFSSVTFVPSGYVLDYNYLGGNVIALVAVPEPGEVGGAIALSLLGIVIVRRQRRLKCAHQSNHRR